MKKPVKKVVKKSDDEPSKIQKKSYSKISYAVFGIGLIVSLISLIAVIFPALISTLVVPNGFEKMGLMVDVINPYETGPLTVLVIFSNAIVFGLYIFRKKIPIISKIFSIDIPQKISLVIVLVVIVGYGSITFSEVNVSDEIYEDWRNVKVAADEFSFEDTSGVSSQIRFFLLQQSMLIFGSYKVIPLLFSMGLLGITYLFTTSLTKNRFSGLVSMGLLLQSYTFLTYDTSSTYTNFWIFFYLVSLYAVIKLWFTNPVFYVASIFSKALTALFAPMSIFFILNSEIPKKQRLIISAIIFVMVIVGGTSLWSGGSLNEDVRWHEFWVGFTSFAFQMRFDVISILFLVPLIFGLFVTSKNNRYANSISILITGILFSAPLLTGLTDQTNQPYRFMPIIVFFAVGVGMLFSKINSKV